MSPVVVVYFQGGPLDDRLEPYSNPPGQFIDVPERRLARAQSPSGPVFDELTHRYARADDGAGLALEKGADVVYRIMGHP